MWVRMCLCVGVCVCVFIRVCAYLCVCVSFLAFFLLKNKQIKPKHDVSNEGRRENLYPTIILYIVWDPTFTTGKVNVL